MGELFLLQLMLQTFLVILCAQVENKSFAAVPLAVHQFASSHCISQYLFLHSDPVFDAWSLSFSSQNTRV
jgi:hypothetical protein